MGRFAVGRLLERRTQREHVADRILPSLAGVREPRPSAFESLVDLRARKKAMARQSQLQESRVQCRWTDLSESEFLLTAAGLHREEGEAKVEWSDEKVVAGSRREEKRVLQQREVGRLWLEVCRRVGKSESASQHMRHSA